MRILAVTNLYPNPQQPQRAPYNRHQFRLLGERNPLHVIAPIAWTDERSFPTPIPELRRVTLDNITVDHPRYYFPPRFGRRFYGHSYRRSIRKTFERAVAEFKPDIVFAPWAYPDGWAAVKLAHEHKLPAVIQVHGSDIKLLGDYPARRKRTIEAVTQAEGVVAVSEDLARDLVSFGVPRERILVNYDGVDPALFHPGNRAAAKAVLSESTKPIVLFIGNLVPVKQVHLLFEAVQGLEVKTMIVGDGPLRASLEQDATFLGLDVRFVGSIPLEELPEYYRAADCFVLPSRSEGVPNVLLEASACGTPWVASNVGGVPEIARLGKSTLVPSGDVAALRTAIQKTLADRTALAIPPQRSRIDAVIDLEAFLMGIAS
ncbi:glycosyltransferase family 4 protein [soil metagenome]